MDDLLAVAQRLALLGRQQIDLIHYSQPRLLIGFKLLEDAFDLRVLLGRNRAAGIRDLQNERGALYFFERGAERRHQRMRKMPYETHRVGEKNLAFRGQISAADGRIERGKHARRRLHVSLCEGVEQRGLSRIRVPHQRHRCHRNRFAPLPLLCPDAAHIFDLLFDMPDAAKDLSPVGFQLSFARSTSADAAAELRHFHAAPRQPREHVFELGQFHLRLTFTSAGVPREDIENQLRAIDDARVDHALDVALL